VRSAAIPAVPDPRNGSRIRAPRAVDSLIASAIRATGFGVGCRASRSPGEGLDNAEVTFGAGLNVISGASNSGKTFVFDAINFCFGGRSPLKPIPEAAGYSVVELEISTQDGRKISLERPFNGGDLTMRDSETPGTEVVLADRFYETKADNVSSFLLDLCSLTDRKVRKNAENQLQNLSFRNIVHLIMVSELDIVKADSPIFSGESTARTADASIFKLLLTGEDDASLVASKKKT
jgi:hypothetical protein